MQVIYTTSKQMFLKSITVRRVASQFILVSPRDHFICPVSSFSKMKEIGWRKVLEFQKNW